MDINAAVETLVRQKLYFERKCIQLEEMEVKLRKEIVKQKIENEALREKIRRLRERP